MAESEQALARALEVLPAAGDDAVGATLTLSGTLAFLGRFDEAAALLDQLDPSPELRGRVTAVSTWTVVDRAAERADSA